MGNEVRRDWTSRGGSGRIKTWVRLLLVCAAISAVVGGCASEAWFRHLTRMEVDVAQSSNRGTAVSVDLVCVYEEALLDRLKSTPARQWFGGERERLRRQYPEGFRRWNWEWASGQAVSTKAVSIPAHAEAVFVYASYQGDEPYRVQVAPLRDVRLFLGETSFRARPRP